MKTPWLASLAALAAASALATPPTPAQLPADANSIVRIDLESLKGIHFFASATNHVPGTLKTDEIPAGINLDQIQQIVLVGCGAPDGDQGLEWTNNGLAYLSGGFDKEALQKETKTKSYAGIDIHEHTLTNGTGKAYFALADDTSLVCSQNLDLLKSALDLRAGKGKRLAADSKVAKLLTSATDLAVFLDLSSLPASGGMTAKSPIPMGENPPKAFTLVGKKIDADHLNLAASVACASAADAEQLRSSLNGLRMMALMGQDVPAPFAKLLNAIQLGGKGDTATLSLALDTETVNAISALAERAPRAPVMRAPAAPQPIRVPLSPAP